MNHKKIQRLWREEGCGYRQRRRRKRRDSSTAPNLVADANRVGAVGFHFEFTADLTEVEALTSPSNRRLLFWPSLRCCI